MGRCCRSAELKPELDKAQWLKRNTFCQALFCTLATLQLFISPAIIVRPANTTSYQKSKEGKCALEVHFSRNTLVV